MEADGKWHDDERSWYGPVLEPLNVLVLTGSEMNEDGVGRVVLVKLNGVYTDGAPWECHIAFPPEAAKIFGTALVEAEMICLGKL